MSKIFVISLVVFLYLLVMSLAFSREEFTRMLCPDLQLSTEAKPEGISTLV